MQKALTVVIPLRRNVAFHFFSSTMTYKSWFNSAGFWAIRYTDAALSNYGHSQIPDPHNIFLGFKI